jgi:acyl dehydratase
MSSISASDIHVGQAIPLGPYRISREELLAFAETFDPQPFHMDEAVAKSSLLGGLATSGWHTASIMMRMLCDAFFIEANALGSTGIKEMQWLKPVYVDDVLSGTMTITGVRVSASKPDWLIVNFDARVWDEKSEHKAAMRSMVFVRALAP